MDFLTGDPAQLPAAISAFFGGQQQQPEPEAPQAAQPQMQPPAAQPQMGATPPMMQGMPGAAPQRDPMMDSISRMMETVTNAYARVKSGQPTDRITEILKSGSVFTPMQEAQMTADAIAGFVNVPGAKSFGERLNSIRANKILEAEKIAKTQIEDEQLQIARDKNMIEAASKVMTERGQIATAYKEWLENFKGTVPPETFKQIAKVSAEALVNRPVATPEQAYHAFAEAVSKMALPAMQDKTSDERFLTEYTALRTKQRAGVPLSPEEQDRMEFISGFRFTKVAPTPTGLGVLQPNMPPIGAAPTVPAAPQGPQPKAAPGQVQMPPGAPKVTRVEIEQKALPEKAQNEFESGLRTLNSLKAMRDGLSKTGIIEGRWQKLKIAVGAGDPEAINFQTAVDNFRVDAQSLIKGIPSDFDVRTFINTLPDLKLPENVNDARMKWHEKNIHLLLALKIGYYKNLGYKVPPEIADIAAGYGVNVNDIKSLTAAEVKQKTGELKIDAIKNTASETKTVRGKIYYRIGNQWLTVE